MNKQTQIIWRKIDDLIPYEYNTKEHTPEQVEKLRLSFERYGWQNAVMIDTDDVIIYGHGRCLGAKAAGLTEAPTIVCDDLTDEQIREYRIADNMLQEGGYIDTALMHELPLVDLEEFGFDFGLEEICTDWFDRSEHWDDSRQDGNDEYNEFLDKFEIAKTTDDCYTPENIYNAVCDWVENEYNVKRENFVRPFYPGGDYQSVKYKNTDIVVDNPPFSILAEILNFYKENGVKFFLFAPTLTLFSSSSSSCALAIGVTVTYENGAGVDTSFLTNLEDLRLRSAPGLYQAIKKANDENLAEMRRSLPKYEYPNEVITSTKLGQFSKYGIDFKVSVEESEHIRALDAQKEQDKGIFGSGYLLSEKAAAEKAAAEKAAAEKAAAEKAAAEKWQLSDRERDIVKRLSQ